MRLTDKTKIITNLEKEIEGLKEQIAEFEIKVTKSEHKNVASARPKKVSQPVDKESIPKTNKKPVKKEIKEKQEKMIEMKSESEKTDSEAERETKRKNVKISEEEQRKVRTFLLELLQFQVEYTSYKINR